MWGSAKNVVDTQDVCPNYLRVELLVLSFLTCSVETPFRHMLTLHGLSNRGHSATHVI